MNYTNKINSEISEAINKKDENKYILAIKKALRYYLNDKITLDVLDSLGARYLPYMEISNKFESILADISALEIVKNPKEIAQKCLDKLSKNQKMNL